LIYFNIFQINNGSINLKVNSYIAKLEIQICLIIMCVIFQTFCKPRLSSEIRIYEYSFKMNFFRKIENDSSRNNVQENLLYKKKNLV
jgi:hypothetical protein